MIMLISHLQAIGPYIRIFGQLDLEQMAEMQRYVENTIAYSSTIPNTADLPTDTICLARFNGQYRRARIIRKIGHSDFYVQFIDLGNECGVKLQEIRLLNFESVEVKILQNAPALTRPFILSGICGQWTPQQLNELNADLTGQIVKATIDVEFGDFRFISIIWRSESLVNYLIYIKKFGTPIFLEKQSETIYNIMSKAPRMKEQKTNLMANNNDSIKAKTQGLIPVRQPNTRVPIASMRLAAIPTVPVPLQTPLASHSMIHGHVLRMPYKVNNNVPVSPLSGTPQTQNSPPKRSVMTFKSNTLMVGSFYHVYCCFVENGPCLFSIHLSSSVDDLNDLMGEIERVPLRNLNERPSIGMACIARFSEDNQLYRAVIMTIKPTTCQVSYVDYGNTEFVSFSDLYEIPTNLLDQKIFAIRFSLSGYKELEPLDDALKSAFKEMVLRQELLLKVMPLEGPPLVQYCELYLNEVNILEALKAYMNRKLFYLPPPPICNDDIVVIRYVESPKKFFIQKIESIQTFDQMMDDLFLHCKTKYTQVRDFVPGSACAVKFENAWYRAEILGTNENRVLIRHVDFGNERNVDPEQLCTISEQLVKFPVQAIRCCIKGFEITESLSDSATVQLEMLAETDNNERRHFKCQIYEIHDDGTFIVNLIDEKMRPELNLMKKLYKLSMPFNKYIGLEKEEYPYTMNPSAPPKPVALVNDYITPPAIFNSTSNHEQEQAANHLSTEWEAKSSNSADSREHQSPSDNYGNRRQHSPRTFKEKSDNRWEQKEQPYTTFKGRNSERPPRFQKQHDENRKFNRDNNSYDQKRNNNNDESTSRYQEQSNQPAAETDDWETETQTAAPAPKPYVPAPINSMPSQIEEYVASDFAFTYNDVIVPSREEVLLCWWVSPHQFYTHNCSAVAQFESLMQKIQLFYKSKSAATNLQMTNGLSIVARFPKDQVLYRATVLACNEKLRKYRVEFVDFGNQATVTNNDIWQLEKRFAEHPVMSQLCSFENIVSNLDHRQITANVERYLKSGLKLFCEYLRKENNLYYADIDVEGASLRQLLIDDGSISEVESNLSIEMLSGQQIRIKIVSVKDFLNFQIEIEGCNLKLLCSYNDIKFVKSNPHLSDEFKRNYEGKFCAADVIDVSKEKILMLQPIIPLLMKNISPRICNYPIVYRDFSVKIAFIETENIIYAHSIFVEEKLGTMLDAMFNYYSEQGTPLTSHTPGVLCAAQSSDGNWYRARITSYEDDSIEVYFIDYGNFELIENLDNVKQLDEQFFDCSALAIRFYFPIKSKTDDDLAIETIRTLTDGYELTLSIVDCYQNCWIADIQSNGQSLINVLRDNYSATDGMDLEYAKNVIDNDSNRNLIAQSPTVSKAQSFDLESIAKVSSPAEDAVTSDSGILLSERSDDAPIAAVDNMIPAYLSHCDNPGRFFLHLTSNFSELQELQDNIQIVAGSLPPLMTAVTGALCIALYTVDETWYRARIIDSEIMAVQFIDYGNTDVLTDNSYVREMNDAFADIPPFAISCALPISPRNTADWVDEANTIFNEAYDKTIYFNYVTQNAKKSYVNLRIDDQNVSDELIAKGLARKLEVLRSGENGFVCHINSLADFYIQMESYADGLELIAGHLSDFESFKVLTDFSVDNICAALFPEDGGWYRAKILSHTSNGTEVLFIDYGNTAVTTELREISAEIANLPFLSKKCSLRMPDHILGWSDAAEAKFHELSAMGETVFIVELIEPSDHAIVDLCVGNRNILEDLEPLCDSRPNIVLDLSSSMGKDDFHGLEIFDVIISHTNGPADFYVQLQSEKDELDRVGEAMSSADELAVIEMPTVGMVCSALYSEDGAYYRAKVIAVGDEQGTEVLFMDYGNTWFSEDLRELPDKWKIRPGLAYQCTLSPHGLLDLSAESTIEKFVQFTIDHQEDLFKIEIIERNVEPWIVTLHSNGYNIYEELRKAETGTSSLFKEIVETIVERGFTDAVVNEDRKDREEVVKNIVDSVISDTLTTDKEIVDGVLSSAVDASLELAARKQVDGEIVKGIIDSAISDTLTTKKEIVDGVLSSAIDASLEVAARKQVDVEIVKGIIDSAIPDTLTTKKEIVDEVLSSAVDASLEVAARKQVDGEIVKEIIDSAISYTLPTVKEIVDGVLSSAVNDSLEVAAGKQVDGEIVKEIIDSAIDSNFKVTANHVDNSTIAQDILDRTIDESLEQCNIADGTSVRITQVYSALDFYIRAESTEKAAEEMNRSLREASSYDKLENPRIGTVCAVLDHTKNSYHRAKILAVTDNGCKVELIDSGVRLTAKDLKTLPNELRFKAALAKHCSIKTSARLSKLDSFKKVIQQNLDKTYKINVLDRHRDPWIVDLSSNEIDLQQELIAMDMVHEAVNASLQEFVKDAVVSHTNSPNDFYIQLSCDIKNLEKITELLYDAVNFAKIDEPETGQLCAAVFPDDGAFYRAEILALYDASYEVLFVDFGNSSISNDIRQLPDNLIGLERIAKQCALENTSEIDFWSEQACDLFTTLVTSQIGETFQVEITTAKDQQPWIVKLFNQSIDLCEELKKLIIEQQSQNSSDVWEEAKDSSGAIVSGEILDMLIDAVPMNGGKKSTATSSTISHDGSVQSFSPPDDVSLAQQLWDGLHKLGILDPNSKAQSTSNLCENMKSNNSMSGLLTEQNDQIRSKSVECIVDKN